MRFYDVHTAGVQRHLTDIAVMNEVKTVTAHLGRIISDAAAQTIAAWWHSPNEPLSTRLSTMGIVDGCVTRENFATDAELAEVDDTERELLNALMAYIAHHQAVAPSGARPCACDGCFDTVFGRVGELCSLCEESGCDSQGSPCERAAVYGPGHDVGNHSECVTESGYCD